MLLVYLMKLCHVVCGCNIDYAKCIEINSLIPSNTLENISYEFEKKTRLNVDVSKINTYVFCKPQTDQTEPNLFPLSH
ncbi:hypothetical protein QVD17_09921 [Tagetes erecta]|uniref:Uncharacterized protein n=1 Tax=Tagetes erecta TaxID=13708 RepID=A0AAD8L6W4_TARER|nr:hypothetical protein QVD17_09921 [Tagetes erecta]